MTSIWQTTSLIKSEAGFPKLHLFANSKVKQLIRTISDSNYSSDIAILNLSIDQPEITGNSMKVQPKSRPTLRSNSQTKNIFSIHRSTINPIRPLLKASTTLPLTQSFDETGGFIKGYN